MPQQIAVGIVGLGGIGSMHGRAMEAVEDAEIEAIADIDDEIRRRAGKRFGVPEPRQYSECKKMLADGDLDAVVIATPHTLHYDQVVTALDSGHHVLCEKPLCTDVEDARDLVKRAEESDQVVMVGYQRHLGPAYSEAAERLDSRDGTPNLLTAEITQDWISGQRDAWRSDPDLSGGGQLYDTGSHLVDVLLWMTGLTPTAVSADMEFYDDEDRVDINASLNVAFEEGARASIVVSGDTPAMREHIHVWDDEGAIYLDGVNGDEPDLTVISGDESECRPYIGGGRQSKAAALIEAIRDGTKPPATVSDAFYVTAVTEAAYESARTGTRVEVEGLAD